MLAESASDSQVELWSLSLDEELDELEFELEELESLESESDELELEVSQSSVSDASSSSEELDEDSSYSEELEDESDDSSLDSFSEPLELWCSELDEESSVLSSELDASSVDEVSLARILRVSS